MADEKTSVSLDDRKYQNPSIKGSVPNAPNPEQQAEMQKAREKIEVLKKWICSKYKDVEAIGIIPPQAAEIFDEENELNEEEKKKKPCI